MATAFYRDAIIEGISVPVGTPEADILQKAAGKLKKSGLPAKGKRSTARHAGASAGVRHKDHSVFENEICELAQVGFDCIDYNGFVDTTTEIYTMDEDALCQYLRMQKQIADVHSISVSQVHGPWRWPTTDATAEGRADLFEKMMRAIRGTALLGCDRMVVHNVMPQHRIDTDPATVRAINRDFFTRLCTYAKDYGVTVCLENMPFACQSLARPHQTLNLVRELNLDNLRICLDTGHAAVLGCSPADAVRMIGKEMLYALHVHDSDGLRDRHWHMGEGVIDWADFASALAEIGFEGCFSTECKLAKNITPEQHRAELTHIYSTAKRIIQGI